MVERITGTMAGSHVPLGTPEMSGAEQGWHGFLTEAHLAGPTRDEVDWSWHATHVGICVAGAGDILVESDIGEIRYRARPGNVTLFPRGFGPATIRQFDGRCRFVAVELGPERLEALFPDVDPLQGWRLAPLIDGGDPQIVALVRSMYAEISEGCPSGALYADALSMALAAYLLGRYGARPPVQPPAQGGLSRRQRAQVVDYIEANIDRQIRLADLAGLVGLSPRQAFRLFRQTFGTTPHRYVTGMRVARARHMLAGTRLPVAEVALSLGFNSQSHFAGVFRKETGATPARYRQDS